MVEKKRLRRIGLLDAKMDKATHTIISEAATNQGSIHTLKHRSVH